MKQFLSLSQYREGFHSKYIQLINGASVHYVEANPQGVRTVIIVHGITGTHYSMLPMASEWMRLGDRVLVVDLPGHGRSNRIAVASFDDMAHWLHEVIQQLCPAQSFVLVGNSFGSGVCAQYARIYGLREECGMVLGAPIPTLAPTMQKLERITSRLPEKIMQAIYYSNRLAEPLRISILLRQHHNKNARHLVSEMIRNEGPLVQHRYAFGVLMPSYYRANVFSTPLPKDIRRRTIVVHGDADRLAGREVYMLMQDFMKGSGNVVVAPRCGHLVHVEAIDAQMSAVDSLREMASSLLLSARLQSKQTISMSPQFSENNDHM